MGAREGAEVEIIPNEQVKKPVIGSFAELAKILGEIGQEPNVGTGPDVVGEVKERTRIRTAKRQVVEAFVRGRVGRTKGIPWLNPERVNPPPIDIPPCYVMQIPPEKRAFLRGGDAEADNALVPYAPPIEWWSNKHKNLYQPKTLLDERVLEMLRRYGCEQVVNLTEESEELEILLKDLSDQEMAISMATWARDTTQDGVDLMRSIVHRSWVTRMFHRGDISSADKAEGPIVLPQPSELYFKTEDTATEIKQLLINARELSEGKIVRVGAYKEKVVEIHEKARDVIDGYRWHIEHESMKDPKKRDEAWRMMQVAYKSYSQILQFGNEPFDQGERFKTFHDLAALIAGEKIDMVGDGRFGDTVFSNNRVDYLDAFMCVVMHYEAMTEALQEFKGEENLLKHFGARALFGDFEESAGADAQQLTLMAVLYFRMPKWQKEAYGELIEQMFAKIQERMKPPGLVVTDWEEPPLYVPSIKIPKHGVAGYEGYDFENSQEVWRAQHLERLIELLDPNNKQIPIKFLRKQTGRIEVENTYLGWGGQTRVGNGFLGEGSDGAYFDTFGFVHPGLESKETQVLQIIKTELDGSWLGRLIELPSLLRPEAVSAQIKELMERSRSNGGVEVAAKFIATLERVLGRKTDSEETELVTMLMDMGMIGRELGKVGEVWEADELTSILEKLKSGKGELGDLGQDSATLLMMAATGVVPREMLANFTLETYAKLKDALTLQMVMAIEKMDNSRLGTILGIRTKHKIVEARRAMHEFLTQKQAENGDYKPQEDLEYRKRVDKVAAMVTRMIHHSVRYDITMRSTMAAVVTAAENGVGAARCSVHGDFVVETLNFVAPEIGARHATTYGEEELLSIPQWLEKIGMAEESGGGSHGFAEFGYDLKGIALNLAIADATANEVARFPDESRLTLKEIEQVMEAGAAHELWAAGWKGERRKVIVPDAKGGSHMMAALALEAGAEAYAALACPDDMGVLFAKTISGQFSEEEKLEALRKIMIIRPHGLAMSVKADGSRGGMVDHLQEIVGLCERNKDWAGAMLASNILASAGYLPGDVNEIGEELKIICMEQIAGLEDHEFEETIRGLVDYTRRGDLEIITAMREALLEKLAGNMKDEAGELVAITTQKGRVEELCGLLSRKARQIQMEDDIAISDKQAVSPTEGYQAEKKLTQQVAERVTEITVAVKQPALTEFDPARFEVMSERAQRGALEAIFTNQGKELTQAQMMERVREMQLTVWRVAAELAMSQGDFMVTTSMEPGLLETETRRQAEQIYEFAANNAREMLQIHLPPLLSVEQMLASGEESNLALQSGN